VNASVKSMIKREARKLWTDKMIVNFVSPPLRFVYLLLILLIHACVFFHFLKHAIII